MKLYIRNKITIIFLAALFMAGCAAQAPYLKLEPTLERNVRVFDNIQYVPLIKLCEAYGLDCKWDSVIRTAILTKNGKIVLRAGSDRILVNGDEKKLAGAVIFTNSTVYVPASFVKNILGFIVISPAPPQAVREAVPLKRPAGRYAIKTIVLDAGHGGKDGGAVGRRLKLKEKDLTLAISRKLRNILEREGIRVIMSRDRDVFISLGERVRIANASGADLFISIHVNASRSRLMNGFECYYLSEATDDNARATEAFENASVTPANGAVFEHSKGLDKTLWDMKLTENRRESAQLASSICSSIDSSFVIRSRGVKTARFYVLKWTRIPSVLVEAGYISNKFEELKLKDESYIDRIVNTIAKGIMVYKDKYERTEGFTG